MVNKIIVLLVEVIDLKLIVLVFLVGMMMEVKRYAKTVLINAYLVFQTPLIVYRAEEIEVQV